MRKLLLNILERTQITIEFIDLCDSSVDANTMANIMETENSIYDKRSHFILTMKETKTIKKGIWNHKRKRK
jgi:hypothetical protein